MKKWSEILSFLMAPQLEYVQVGVTSHCNALCIYCPKAVYKKKWQNSHLSIATFEKLLPDLRRTKFVHLQGWGEPLLNPQFFKMVEKLKALGHSVGTTSNAGLWNDEISRQIVEQNVDLVAFSLAGTSDGQDKIRCGTSLSQVITAIKSLQAAKRIHKTNKPSVHIAYMLLRSGMEEVRFLPDLINGLGINQVVISVLDFVPEASLVSECIMPKDYAEEKEIKNYLSEIVEKGKKFGIEIFYRLISPSRKLGRCSENISNATYIAPDG
ncbi:MAG: radical SAM protein, partial [Candidatus Hadarchaeum sp.]